MIEASTTLKTKHMWYVGRISPNEAESLFERAICPVPATRGLDCPRGAKGVPIVKKTHLHGGHEIQQLIELIKWINKQENMTILEYCVQGECFTCAWIPHGVFGLHFSAIFS